MKNVNLILAAIYSLILTSCSSAPMETKNPRPQVSVISPESTPNISQAGESKRVIATELTQTVVDKRSRTVPLPENQPVQRWVGQALIPIRPADPLPDWRQTEFRKLGVIMKPDKNIPWMAKDVFNPSAVVGEDGRVYMFFRAENMPLNGKWQSRVGLAVSEDGIHFHPEKDKNGQEILTPIIEPSEAWDQQGTEDPRVVEYAEPAIDEKGQSWRYGMTYTAYDGKMARLAIAISNDRIHWQKKGLIFRDNDVLQNPCVKNSPWTKSGGIVPQKINGLYVMYFGENKIFMATSKNGIQWDYPLHEKPIFMRREGFFDQGLVEAGPTPWIDSEGIHLLYHGDGPDRGYQVGEIVFDINEPSQIVRRSEAPILSPDQPFEKEGQVGAVVFAEGLVFFHNHVILYYGAADGKIAAATAPSLHP